MKLLLEGQCTERLLFRRLRCTDFEAWLPFHQEPKSSQFWEGLPADPATACKEQFAQTFERYEKNLGGMNALTLKSNGNLIGLCGLLVQTVDMVQELEIGYSILPDHWQKGYATEAALECKSYAFENGFADSLISIIQVKNEPSKKVARNLGMRADKTTFYNDNEVAIFRVHYFT